MTNSKSIESKVKNFIIDNSLIPQGSRILIALSGGKDSITLLSIMEKIKHDLDCGISIVHVNHRLRGKESDRDERFAREIATKCKLDFFLRRIRQSEYAKLSKCSPEERARILRYKKFYDVYKRSGCNLVATGHTKEDLAENTMIRFVKGSSPLGLSPIKSKSGIYVRPLLSLDADDISNYIVQNNLTFVEDSSNKNLDFQRNFIRNVIFKEIKKKMNKNLTATLNDVSRIQGWTADFLNNHIDIARDKSVKIARGATINIKHFTNEPKIIQFLLLRKIYSKIANERELSTRTIFNIIDMLNSQKTSQAINLPQNFIAAKRYNSLNIFKKRDKILKVIEIDQVPEKVKWGKNLITFGRVKRSEIKKLDGKDQRYYLDYSKLKFPLVVRGLLPGDIFCKLGGGGTKKLRKFFIDKKVPSEERLRIPLLVSDGKIAVICGYGLSESFKVDERTEEILKIEYISCRS